MSISPSRWISWSCAQRRAGNDEALELRVRTGQNCDERIPLTGLRSAGFGHFVTRGGIVAGWDHVGSMISFDPVARDGDLALEDDLLAVGQDFGIVGLDLDAAALVAALDEVALTDAELTAGPAAWARFADPFPLWPMVVDPAA